MNVVLSDSCWAQDKPTWTRELCDILVLLNQRPHHPIAANALLMQRWCESQLPAYVEELKARLISSNLRANAVQVTVTPGGNSAIAGPPPWSVTAQAALPLLERPLSVYLENDESDFLFLCSVSTEIGNLVQNKAVAVVHGGGSNMASKIEAAGSDILAQWRTFFVFDSDRLHPSELAPGWTPPGGDGCQGHVFETACGKANLPPSRWRMLRRRSIENYLPQAVLAARDSTCTSTLFSPSIGQMLHHYNMKEGLRGDGIWPANPKKVVRSTRSRGKWNALDSTDKDALQSGFGRDVAEEFRNVSQTHRWDSEILAESDAMIAALYDAL